MHIRLEKAEEKSRIPDALEEKMMLKNVLYKYQTNGTTKSSKVSFCYVLIGDIRADKYSAKTSRGNV